MHVSQHSGAKRRNAGFLINHVGRSRGNVDKTPWWMELGWFLHFSLPQLVIEIVAIVFLNLFLLAPKNNGQQMKVL